MKTKSLLFLTFQRPRDGKKKPETDARDPVTPSHAENPNRCQTEWRTTERASALCSAFLYTLLSPNQNCRIAYNTHTPTLKHIHNTVEMHYFQWVAFPNTPLSTPSNTRKPLSEALGVICSFRAALKAACVLKCKVIQTASQTGAEINRQTSGLSIRKLTNLQITIILYYKLPVLHNLFPLNRTKSCSCSP